MRGSVNIKFRATTGDLASDINKINQAIAQTTSQIVRLSVQTGAGLKDIQTAVQTAVAATAQANRQIMAQVQQGIQTASNVMASAVNVSSVAYKTVSGLAVEMTRKIGKEVVLFSDLITTSGQAVANEISELMQRLTASTRDAIAEGLEPALELFRKQVPISAAEFVRKYGPEFSQALAATQEAYERLTKRIAEYRANLDSLTPEELEHLKALEEERNALILLREKLDGVSAGIIKQIGGVKVLIEQTDYSAAAMQRAQAAVARFAQTLGELGVRAAAIQDVSQRIAYLEKQLERFPELLAEEWLKELEYAFEELGPGMVQAFREIQTQLAAAMRQWMTEPEFREAPTKFFEAFSREFARYFQSFARTAFLQGMNLEGLWQELVLALRKTKFEAPASLEFRKKIANLFTFSREELALPIEEQMALLHRRFAEINEFLRKIETAPGISKRAIEKAQQFRQVLNSILNVERANIETVQKMSVFYLDAAKSMDSAVRSLRQLKELQAIADQFKTLAMRIDQAQISTMDLYKIVVRARAELSKFGPATEPAVAALTGLQRELKGLLQQRLLAERLGSIAEAIIGRDARKMFRNLDSFKQHLNRIVAEYERLWQQRQRLVEEGKAEPIPGFEELVMKLREWREEWSSAKSFEGVLKVLQEMQSYLRATAPQQLAKGFRDVAVSLEAVPINRLNQLTRNLAQMRRGMTAKDPIAFANALARLSNIASATQSDFDKLVRSLDNLRVKTADMVTGTKSLTNRIDRLRAYASKLVSGFSELDRFMTKILIRVGVLQSVRFMLMDVARAINSVWRGIDKLKDIRSTIADFQTFAIVTRQAIPELNRLADALGDAVDALEAARMARPLMLLGVSPEWIERLFRVVRATLPHEVEPKEVQQRVQEIVQALVSGSEQALENLAEQYGIVINASMSLNERVREFVIQMEAMVGYTSRYGAAVGQLTSVSNKLKTALEGIAIGAWATLDPMRHLEQALIRLMKPGILPVVIRSMSQVTDQFTSAEQKANDLAIGLQNLEKQGRDTSGIVNEIRNSLEPLMPLFALLYREGVLTVDWWRQTLPELRRHAQTFQAEIDVIGRNIQSRLESMMETYRKQQRELPRWLRAIQESSLGLEGFSRRLAMFIALSQRVEGWNPFGPILQQIAAINTTFLGLMQSWQDRFNAMVEDYTREYKSELIPLAKERMKYMEGLSKAEQTSILRAVEMQAKLRATRRAFKEIRADVEKQLALWEKFIPPGLEETGVVRTFRELQQRVRLWLQGLEMDLIRLEADVEQAIANAGKKTEQRIKQTARSAADDIEQMLRDLKLNYSDSMLFIELSTVEKIENILKAFRRLDTEIKPALAKSAAELGDRYEDVRNRVAAAEQDLRRDLLNELKKYVDEVSDTMTSSSEEWSSAVTEAMRTVASDGLGALDLLIINLQERGREDIAKFLKDICTQSASAAEFIQRISQQAAGEINAQAIEPVRASAEETLKQFSAKHRQFAQEFNAAILQIDTRAAEAHQNLSDRIDRTARASMLRIRRQLESTMQRVDKVAQSTSKNYDQLLQQLDELEQQVRQLGASQEQLNRIERVRTQIIQRETRAIQEQVEAELKRAETLATLRAQLQAYERARQAALGIRDEQARLRQLERINKLELETLQAHIARLNKLNQMTKVLDLLDVIKDFGVKLEAARALLGKIAEIMPAEYERQLERLGDKAETEAERIASSTTQIVLDASTAIASIMAALQSVFVENAEALDEFKAQLDGVLNIIEQRARETELTLLEALGVRLFRRGISRALDLLGLTATRRFYEAKSGAESLLDEINALEEELTKQGRELPPGLAAIRDWLRTRVDGKSTVVWLGMLNSQIEKLNMQLETRQFRDAAKTMELLARNFAIMTPLANELQRILEEYGYHETAAYMVENLRYRYAQMILRVYRQWLDSYSELNTAQQAWLNGLVSVSNVAADLAQVFETIAELQDRNVSRTAYWLRAFAQLLRTTDKVYRSIYKGVRIIKAMRRGESALQEVAETFKFISTSIDAMKLEASWAAFSSIASGITGILSAGVALWQLYENYRRASKRAEEEAMKERERRLEEWQRKVEEATGWMESAIADAIREGWEKGFESVDLTRLIIMRFQEELASVFVDAIFAAIGKDKFTRMLERYARLSTQAAKGHEEAARALQELQPQLFAEAQNMALEAQRAFRALYPYLQQWTDIFSGFAPGGGIPYWPGTTEQPQWYGVQPQPQAQAQALELPGAMAAPQLMIMPPEQPQSGLALAEMTDSLHLIANNTAEMVSILKRVENKLAAPQNNTQVVVQQAPPLNEPFSGRT